MSSKCRHHHGITVGLLHCVPWVISHVASLPANQQQQSPRSIQISTWLAEIALQDISCSWKRLGISVCETTTAKQASSPAGSIEINRFEAEIGTTAVRLAWFFSWDFGHIFPWSSSSLSLVRNPWLQGLLKVYANFFVACYVCSFPTAMAEAQAAASRRNPG